MIDYTIPAKFGQIRSGVIDPMTLANLREQVSARRQAAQDRAAEYERQNTLRNLLQQSFAKDDAGNVVETPALGQYLQLGGDVNEAVRLKDLLSPSAGVTKWTAPRTLRDVVRDGRSGQLVLTPEGETFEPYPEEKPRPIAAPKPSPVDAATTRAAVVNKQKFDTANRDLEEMDSLLAQYEDTLKKRGAGIMPDSDLDSAWSDLMVNYNAKVAGLGALAGPDLGMLEKIIIPPRSPKGAYYGTEALLRQVQMAKGRVARTKARLRRDLMPQSNQPNQGSAPSSSPKPPIALPGVK